MKGVDKVSGFIKVFADNVSVAGQTDYKGRQERKVTVAYSGTQGASSVFTAFLVDSDGNEYPLSGVRVSGDLDMITSAKPGEVVEYTKPSGLTMRVKFTKPSGGTVSAKATLM
ncbi:hypothetical protein OHJ21_19240 [Virgibacillus sp. LDC1]|nr:hypothetical protein [Virgibacillus sp. LDC1]